MYFVAGITGQVGGATARQLLKQGESVRALVCDVRRAADWAAQGVDLRQGDLQNAENLAEALDGVEGAYLMMLPEFTPAPGFPLAKKTIVSYVEALRRTHVPRVVFLSSFGSEQPDRLGNITSTHLMEEALGDLPFPTALLRAGSFLENYAYGLKTAAASGTLNLMLDPTDRKVPMVATEDVGCEVARLLMEGWEGKKLVEIGTPRSPNEVAKALGEVLGREVTAQAIPRESWSQTLEAMGVPAGMSGPYEELMDGLNSGWIHFGAPGTELVQGTTTPVSVYGRIQEQGKAQRE